MQGAGIDISKRRCSSDTFTGRQVPLTISEMQRLIYQLHSLFPTFVLPFDLTPYLAHFSGFHFANRLITKNSGLECNLQLLHGVPRQRAISEHWFWILDIYRSLVYNHLLLWYVLLAREMRPIHEFDNRGICCTLLCVGCYLCVRILIPAKALVP